ncbi:hypothetical protein C8J57DRAFT_1212011 [Mycena rebaudengoi]|nr:hypothetical protein C8J57DRAFT_1212011 [Mycena rebaudengoi]
MRQFDGGRNGKREFAGDMPVDSYKSKTSFCRFLLDEKSPLWAWPVINRALKDEGGDDPLTLCEQCLPQARDCVCTTAHQQPAGSDEERGHEAQHGAGGRVVVIPKERKGGGSVSTGNQAAQAAGKNVGSGGGRAEEGGLQAGRARTSAAVMLWLLERVTQGFWEPGLYLGAAWNEHEEQTTEASVTSAGKFDKRDLWEEEEDVLPEHWPKPFN